MERDEGKSKFVARARIGWVFFSLSVRHFFCVLLLRNVGLSTEGCEVQDVAEFTGC